VIGIYTGRHFAGLCKPMRAEIHLVGYKTTERAVVAVDRVRFIGEEVAVVVADSRYLAEDAADLVEVEYEPLEAVVDVEKALAADAPLVHEAFGDNVMYRSDFTAGDVEGGFASAHLVLHETFRSARVAGVPLEPRGCLASYEPGRGTLTEWSSTQIPHLLRTALAGLLGIAESQIRVITPEVGGGFGTKAHVYPEEAIVAVLSRKLGRPVKWIQDRREDLLTSIHARDHVFRVSVAVNEDGLVQAIKSRVLTNAGAYSSIPFGCTLEPTGGARQIPGAYKIPAYAYETYAIATHTCPAGAYRGVAQPNALLTIEGMMDRIGRALGIDPAEVRSRNLVQPQDFPYVNVVGMRYDTGSYLESMQRALRMSDYHAFRKRQTPSRLEGQKYRGIGICCFTESTGLGSSGWRARGVRRIPGFDGALVKIEPTGHVTAIVSTAGAGQGHETTFAQLIAEELGLLPSDITVIEGDTAVAPYGSGTFASRSVVVGGGAAIQACGRVREKMTRLAAHLLESAPQDIVIEEGRAFVRGVPGGGVTVQQIAELAYSMSAAALPEGEEFGLESTSYYDPPLVTVANGTVVAAVAVDARTGQIDVERYVVVHDCGRVINPMIVEGQLHGGTAQGVGEALMEAMVYDGDGQHLSATLMDYLLPTASDMFDMELGHIESPSIDVVGGFKGVGEAGVLSAVPALVNAVADALARIGANVNQIPMTPDRVLALIEGATDGSR
jgi:carbon-monoxide dehydrogenase large subunit